MSPSLTPSINITNIIAAVIINPLQTESGPCLIGFKRVNVCFKFSYQKINKGFFGVVWFSPFFFLKRPHITSIKMVRPVGFEPTPVAVLSGLSLPVGLRARINYITALPPSLRSSTLLALTNLPSWVSSSSSISEACLPAILADNSRLL